MFEQPNCHDLIMSWQRNSTSNNPDFGRIQDEVRFGGINLTQLGLTVEQWDNLEREVMANKVSFVIDMLSSAYEVPSYDVQLCVISLREWKERKKPPLAQYEIETIRSYEEVVRPVWLTISKHALQECRGGSLSWTVYLPHDMCGIVTPADLGSTLSECLEFICKSATIEARLALRDYRENIKKGLDDYSSLGDIADKVAKGFVNIDDLPVRPNERQEILSRIKPNLEP